MILIHQNNYLVSEEDIITHLTIMQNKNQESQVLILRKMFQTMLRTSLLNSENTAVNKESESPNFSEISINLDQDISLKLNLSLIHI